MLVGAIIAILIGATPSSAQSRTQVCRSLTAQLSSLGNSPGGNSAKYRQYSNAVRKQQIQLNKANRAAKRYQCRGARARTNGRCKQIGASIAKMRSNLVSLERTRQRYAPTAGASSRKRQQIRRALEKNRCYNSDEQIIARKPEKKSRRRTLLEQIFGVRTYNDRGGRDFVEIDPDSQFSSRYGTFRTLCVRKVDGYYFPISFSTVPERFLLDEEQCQKMCPNFEVELYVHQMPQEDSEDMISYRREIAYKDEPFAFAYRKQHNPELKCRISTTAYDIAAQENPNGEERAEDTLLRVGTPVFRKDPAEIPDAYDNKISALTLAQVKSHLEESEKPVSSISDRDFKPDNNIRIVGPAFFPVQ